MDFLIEIEYNIYDAFIDKWFLYIKYIVENKKYIHNKINKKKIKASIINRNFYIPKYLFQFYTPTNKEIRRWFIISIRYDFLTITNSYNQCFAISREIEQLIPNTCFLICCEKGYMDLVMFLLSIGIIHP